MASDQAAYQEMYQLTHQTAVPQVLVDGQIIIGYSEAWLRDKLGLNAAPTPTVTTPPVTALQDPSWDQLLSFLKTDSTDKLIYQYPGFVCQNFAETLQQNARKAGWRCALVRLDMTGYSDPYKLGIPSDAGHACNAFQTSDRGLVYIDCTGLPAGVAHPENMDKMVSVKVGEHYLPVSLFPESGWLSTWQDMGLVTGIHTNW